MEPHEINLARDFVLNARRRKTIYGLMMVYILLSCVLMVFTANRATHRIQGGLDFDRQSKTLQQHTGLRYSTPAGMETYAGELKGELQRKSVLASAINAALPDTTYSTLPLLNLLAGSSQDGSIYKLYFKQKDEESGKPMMVFSIMIPETGAESRPETLESIQQWRNDPSLANEFIAITPTTTERANIGSKRVSILKYNAVFREN